MRLRSWTLTALLLALACGRTGLGTAQHGPGGTHGPGVADTGGSTVSSGGTAGAASGPCGEATCLTSLFQTCVPAGSCAKSGTGGPSAVVSNICYANGVTVSYVGGLNGTDVVTTLTVSRDGTPCYAIKATSGSTSSAFTYVISGPNLEVATAVTADKEGSIAVTCHGQEPILTNFTCLHPVTNSPDNCDLATCP